MSTHSLLLTTGSLLFLLSVVYTYIVLSISPIRNYDNGHQPDTSQSRSLQCQGIPPMVCEALRINNATGHLVGNSTHLTFVPYANSVDLRILVLTMDRAASLKRCLHAINSAVFADSVVSVHIWVDLLPRGVVSNDVINVANEFHFDRGHVFVHVQPRHVGVQQQWLTTWRAPVVTTEVAVIIEDDVDVSQYFWLWLRRAHEHYDSHSDVSGYGLSHPGIDHKRGNRLDISTDVSIYKYKVIATWGFSPHRESWRHFQEWFYRVEQNSTFKPLVPGVLPTLWYMSEDVLGRGRDLWEMWHIYYTNERGEYTVMFNSPQGLLAVNRHERGVHDGGRTRAGARERLCCARQTTIAQLHFPRYPPKFGYDGQREI